MTVTTRIRRWALCLSVALCAASAVACEESLQGVDPEGPPPTGNGPSALLPVGSQTLAFTFGDPTVTSLPLRLRVVDALGRPVRSATVKFDVLMGAGAFSADSTITNDQGFTQVQFTPLTAGTVIADARVELPGGGTESVQFTVLVANDPAVAAAVSRVSGDGQAATIGSVAAQPMVVRVVNADGTPVANHPVVFTLQTSAGIGAGVSDTRNGPFQGQVEVTTDASGTARAFLRMGSQVGGHVVAATTVTGEGANQESRTITFGAVATASQQVALLVPVSGQTQTAIIDTLHERDDEDNFRGRDPNPFVVQALDAFNNPVAGATVRWFVADGGGFLFSLTTVTDANGLTSNQLFEPTEGRNAVVAFAPGAAGSITFTVTGVMLEEPEEDDEGG